MELPRIQYITHPNEDFSNLSWIDQLFRGGVRWIQLRIKEADLEKDHPELHYKHTFMEIADLVKEKTAQLGMMLTINDEVDIASFSGANGVHLGKEDQDGFEHQRSFPIQGATAHCVEDMLTYPLEQIDYFGVGPLRSTSTKRNTKQPLGVEGYQNVLKEMKKADLQQPVFAIGGIQESDITRLREAGVYGVAISGCIHHAQFDEALIKRIVNYVEEK